LDSVVKLAIQELNDEGIRKRNMFHMKEGRESCKVKRKGKAVPVHATTAYRGSRSTVAVILNLGTRWR
jgi:hypothetical protein